MTIFGHIDMFDTAKWEANSVARAWYIHVGEDTTDEEIEELSKAVCEYCVNDSETQPGDLEHPQSIEHGWYYIHKDRDDVYRWRHIDEDDIETLYALDDEIPG